MARTTRFNGKQKAGPSGRKGPRGAKASQANVLALAAAIGRANTTKSKAVSRPKKAGASRSSGARTSGNIFDPNSTQPIPVAARESSAYSFSGLVRKSGFATATNPLDFHILAISNCGCSATVMAELYVTTGGTASGTAAWHVDKITQSAAAGGATTGRAMKVGLRMVNTTKALDVGGEVFMLSTPVKLTLPQDPTTMTIAEITALKDEIVNHSRTRVYAASQFTREGLEVSVHPTDQTDYTDYLPWMGTESVDDFFSHVASFPSGLGVIQKPQPMSVLWVVVPAVTTANDYLLNVRGQWYLRWPIDLVMANNHREVPTASQATINLQRKNAEMQSLSFSRPKAFSGKSSKW